MIPRLGSCAQDLYPRFLKSWNWPDTHGVGEASPDLQPATHDLDHTLQRCDVHIGAALIFETAA